MNIYIKIQKNNKEVRGVSIKIPKKYDKKRFLFEKVDIKKEDYKKITNGHRVKYQNKKVIILDPLNGNIKKLPLKEIEQAKSISDIKNILKKII